jgi:hypothetical protein
MDGFRDEHPADMALRMARRVDGRSGEFLRLYLGVDGGGRMTGKEIASRYRVTHEHVRQMMAKARDLVRLAMDLEGDGPSVDDLIVAGRMREARPATRVGVDVPAGPCPCPGCSGTGLVWYAAGGSRPCPRCLGSGRADATGADVAGRWEC